MIRLFLLLLGVNSLLYFPLTTTQTTELDSSWKTTCSFHLDGYRELYIGIENTGDNAASDCQVQTWDGDSWEPSGTSIPGCSTLASGADVLWPRTSMSPNDHLRVQMKSTSGTTVGCVLYRRR